MQETQATKVPRLLDRPKKGMRGAAPWTQRHMQSQMEQEKRQRDSSPPPPGSARASLRTPKELSAISYRIELLHDALTRVRAHKRTVSVTFWEVGAILQEIEDFRLYEAKGYATLAHMLEREELPWEKATCLHLLRCARVFKQEAAKAMGVARAFEVLRALEAPSMPVVILDTTPILDEAG